MRLQQRKRFLVGFCAVTGLRIGEALALGTGDFLDDYQTVRILQSN